MYIASVLFFVNVCNINWHTPFQTTTQVFMSIIKLMFIKQNDTSYMNCNDNHCRSVTSASVWREVEVMMIIWWWLRLLMGRFPDCKLNIYAVASAWVVYWQHPQIIETENYKYFIECVFHFDWLTVIILSCDHVSILDLLFSIISTTHTFLNELKKS